MDVVGSIVTFSPLASIVTDCDDPIVIWLGSWIVPEHFTVIVPPLATAASNADAVQLVRVVLREAALAGADPPATPSNPAPIITVLNDPSVARRWVRLRLPRK
ncbi:MAG: hypothetical protein ABSD78_17605 [Acidimicrobiales bacterium]